MVEAPLPGRLSMYRCLPPRLVRTLEEHYCPWLSSFGVGVLGLGRMQQVQQYQGGECI